MKAGDDIWLIFNDGTKEERLRARIHVVTPKTVKIRRECFGISSIIFLRNVPDSYPMYEQVWKAHGNKPKYRIEPR